MQEIGKNLVTFVAKCPLPEKQALPVAGTVTNRLSRALLGPTFHYSVAKDEEYESEVRVTVSKCFFKDFFEQQKLPFLSTLFCDWSKGWSASLDEQRHHLIFDKKTCMLRGDSCCQFSFRSMERLDSEEVSRVLTA